MCDEVHYNPDGTIQPIYPNRDGVCSTETGETTGKVTILLDAAGAPYMRGALRGTRAAAEVPGYTGTGYVTGFTMPHFGIVAMAQSCIYRTVRLKMRYNNPGEAILMKLMVNDAELYPPTATAQTYDKSFTLPHTEGWEEYDFGLAKLVTGENHIRFYTGGQKLDTDLMVDAFILEQED